MADESNNAPVLDYRSPANDEVPEIVYVADELIAENAPPQALLPHFKDPQQAANYYGRAMSRLYSGTKLGHECVVCAAAGHVVPVAFLWRTKIKPRVFSFGLRAVTGTAHFATCHPMCNACAARYRDRWTRYSGKTSMLSLIRSLSWIGLIIGSLAAKAMERKGDRFVPGLLFGSAVAIIACLVVSRVMLSRCLPRQVRALLHWTVQFRALAVSSSNDSHEASDG